MGSLHTWGLFINTQLTCTAGEKSRSLWVLNILISNHSCQATLRFVTDVSLSMWNQYCRQAFACCLLISTHTHFSKVTLTIFLVNIFCWITTLNFLLKWSFPFSSLKPFYKLLKCSITPCKALSTNWILYLVIQKWKPSKIPFSKKESQGISRWISNRISTQGVYISHTLITRL